MNMTIEVERPFKNGQGYYDVDYIDVILWKGLAETASVLGKEGKYIAVKGRLQSNRFENEKGYVKTHELVADRIHFFNKPQE
jgi:single-strand DNA-binding protein